MTVHTDPAALRPATGLPRRGSICLVGAGPGAADLLTLRALDRIRAADVVFYDRLIDPAVLALIPPGTPRVFVGKTPGHHAWPQDRIDAAIVAAALSGRRVVRLKSGDPSIFGRAAEEIAAARAHDIPVEVVPGVTAASAGAARLCRPLTERGLTERLVIATATCRPGDDWLGLADLARPGTTLALYMAMNRLPEVQDQLRRAGLPDDTPVEIIAAIETPAEARLQTTLGRLSGDGALGHPAIIFVRIAKVAAPAALPVQA